MTTSKPQKLLLRLIVLFAICASIPRWPATPKQGVISEQLGLIVPVAAQAPVTLDRSIRDYKLPSEIPWVERNGTGSLTLYGDASKPGGIYVSLLRRPFDNWSAPHTHPTERYATVLEGTFLAGTGPVQDRNRVDALRVGTVVSEVPGRMHYDGVGQDGVTLFFIGMGGTNSGPANEAPRAPGGPNVDPTARVAKKLEDMVWTKAADGSTFVNVFGDPGKAVCTFTLSAGHRIAGARRTATPTINSCGSWADACTSARDRPSTRTRPSECRRGRTFTTLRTARTTRGRRMRTSGFWLLAWDQPRQRERPTRNSEPCR